MSDTPYLEQTQSMMRELRMLRAQNKAQADTIGLVKKQYDDLAGDYRDKMDDFQRRLHDAYTDRDVAEREVSEIKIILQTVAQTIVQGLNANKGDQTPPLQAPTSPRPGNHPALVRAVDESK